MIMKTWALCALAATAVQIVLAMKCRWYWGLILPACFGAFTIYAWVDLMSIGIQFSVLAALAIPPIWLVSIFDVFYCPYGIITTNRKSPVYQGFSVIWQGFSSFSKPKNRAAK